MHSALIMQSPLIMRGASKPSRQAAGLGMSVGYGGGCHLPLINGKCMINADCMINAGRRGGGGGPIALMKTLMKTVETG